MERGALRPRTLLRGALRTGGRLRQNDRCRDSNRPTLHLRQVCSPLGHACLFSLDLFFECLARPPATRSRLCRLRGGSPSVGGGVRGLQDFPKSICDSEQCGSSLFPSVPGKCLRRVALASCSSTPQPLWGSSQAGLATNLRRRASPPTRLRSDAARLESGAGSHGALQLLRAACWGFQGLCDQPQSWSHLAPAKSTAWKHGVSWLPNRTGMLRLVGPSEQWGKLRDLQKCAPRQLLVIRGSSNTSAGNVAGFLGVI